MKRVRITGGPAPANIRIMLMGEDEGEGAVEGLDITSQVFSLRVQADGRHLAKATLTMFAEVDMQVEVDDL